MQQIINKFPHCPNCKSKHNLFINNHKYRCENCDYSFYKNVASSVAVIIKKNQEILFTVRNQKPKKGMLDLPGGFVDPFETAEECCSREIYEELGIQINAKDFNYIQTLPNHYEYKNVLYYTLDLFFSIELIDLTDLKINQNEIQKIHWYSRNQIPIERIGFNSIQKFFTK